MSLKYKMIFGFIGFLLSNTIRTHIKLDAVKQEVIDLKDCIKDLECDNEWNESIIRDFDHKETYGYWYEYVDMRERVDSLRTAVRKLKSMN